MNKLTGYKLLFEIKENNKDVDVKEYVRLLSESKNNVPDNIVKFIHNYIKQPELRTYDILYEKRRKNPLYKNLVNESLSSPDKAIALSSLLTQSMIGMKTLKESDSHNGNEIINDYVNSMLVTEITKALDEYSKGNESLLNECFNNVRNRIKTIYSKN